MTAYLKSKKLFSALALILIISGLWVASAVANANQPEVWVCALTGDDGNTGEEGAPFATIGKGVEEVAEGGTVYVVAGQYTDMVVVDKANITISGEEGAVLGTESDNYGFFVDASGVTIEGFTIQGFMDAIHLTGDADGSTIRGNTLTGNEFGINACCVEGLNIAGNTISDNYFGISVYGVDIIITGNTVTDNTVKGIEVEGENIGITGNTATGNQFGIYACCADNVDISKNIVSDNDQGGIACENTENSTVSGNTMNDNGFGGMLIRSSSDITISGNTVNGNGVMGIMCEFNKNVTVSGNIVKNNEGGGIVIIGEGNSVIGNLVRNNGSFGIGVIGVKIDEGIQLDANGNNVPDIDENIIMGNLVAGNGGGEFDFGDEGPPESGGILATPGTVIKYNAIYDNIDYGVYLMLEIPGGGPVNGEITTQANGEGTVDATLNWWGDESGPGRSNPGGDGDKVNDGVLFDPWLMELVVSPDTVQGESGEEITITATLMDSEGEVVESAGFEVLFTVTGTNNFTEAVLMENGIAVLVYTSTAEGEDNITAEVLFSQNTAGLQGETDLELKGAVEELPDTGNSVYGLIMAGLLMVLGGIFFLLQRPERVQ